MTLSRSAAVLLMSLIGALVAPHAASAAPATPPAPLGVVQMRTYDNAAETTVWWLPTPHATRYEITVTSGTTSTTYTVPASQPLDEGDSYSLGVPTPDRCATYRITIAARNAGGMGGAATVVEKSLAPTVVTKAFATRGTGPAIGKFTMSAPQWRGYAGDSVSGAVWQDDTQNPSAALTVKLDLVRLADNKVVKTATWSVGKWTAPRTQSFTALEAKRAYVLRVTASNGWGSCTRQQGRILLARLP